MELQSQGIVFLFVNKLHAKLSGNKKYSHVRPASGIGFDMKNNVSLHFDTVVGYTIR